MHRDGGHCSDRQRDESCCKRGNPDFKGGKGFRSYLTRWARASRVPGDAHGALGWKGLSSSARTHLKWVLVQAPCWEGLWTLLTWVRALPCLFGKKKKIFK